VSLSFGKGERESKDLLFYVVILSEVEGPAFAFRALYQGTVLTVPKTQHNERGF